MKVILVAISVAIVIEQEFVIAREGIKKPFDAMIARYEVTKSHAGLILCV